jgi:hypothetical protein
MCLFKIPTPKALPTPPPIQPMQDTNTALPDSKPLVDQDDVASIQYGTGQKKAGPAAGKKTGTDQLKIPLNTGVTTGSETGGLNV